MWRPDDWEEKVAEAVKQLGKLPEDPGFPIIIQHSIEWEMLKATIYNAGADAILEALKREGKHIYTGEYAVNW